MSETRDVTYAGVGRRIPTFDFQSALSRTNRCQVSADFLIWCDELVQQWLDKSLSPVKLAQSKVLLLDAYMNYRTLLPEGHRDLTNDEEHFCIYRIFIETYDHIRKVELFDISPPAIFEQKQTVPAPPQNPWIGIDDVLIRS